MSATIDAFISSLVINHQRPKGPIFANGMRFIKDIVRVLNNDQIIVDLEPGCVVCSDIRGSFLDLIRILQSNGPVSSTKYVFLGNHLGSGQRNVELLMLLFSLKVRYPKNIFLIKGFMDNIERIEGFREECEDKGCSELVLLIHEAFKYLPIACIIGGKYLCMNNGITKSVKTLIQLRVLNRPLDSTINPIVAELFSSTLSISQQFFHENGISLMIRGNSDIQKGYQYNEDNTVLSIISSRQANNESAVVSISSNTEHSLVFLPKWVPIVSQVNFDDHFVNKAPHRRQSNSK